MSEWKECKLAEIATIVDCEHKTAPLIEYGEYISVRTSNIENGKIDFDSANRVSYETYLEWTKRMKPDEGDIILAREAPVGEVGYVPKNKIVCLGQRTVLIKPNIDYIDSKYLLYYLTNGETKYDLISRSTGSVVEHLNVKDIKDYPLTIIESLPKQRAIASVLSSLDDKIDLLHRQNKTLEAMAETLFRQWFVEEAQEGWDEKELKEVIDIAIGRTPPRKESQWFSTNPNDIKWISIKDLGNDGAFIYTTSEYLTKEAVETFNIPVIPKDTVVLSFKMTVGRVAITTEEMLSNEAIAQFKFNSKTQFSKEYLFLFLKNYKYETFGSTSSIVTSINSAMIKEMTISIPDLDTMTNFQNITESYFNKIKANQSQIRTLEKLRDMLLPKLMSGEVRVGN